MKLLLYVLSLVTLVSAASSSASSSSISRVVTMTTAVTSSKSSSTSSAATGAPTLLKSATINSKILVIARDDVAAGTATWGLNGYGIPFQTLIVPQSGVQLPTLNSTSTVGNYGGIIVASQVAYDYGNGNFSSALTATQWQQLYNYQLAFGVRMVQYDVYPGPDSGSAALGGCCDADVEQNFYFTNTTAFSQAGLVTGPSAGVSSSGLYHYPATIADAATTYEIARFAANANFGTVSTAGVINNFAGRQQMVLFIGLDTSWSATSNFLQHAYITWLTRGLYTGYRRVNFNTQIDDMFLPTDIYSPNGTSYRVVPADMSAVASWVPKIQAKMPKGSYYRPEIGYNGNGNIDYVDNLGAAAAKSCAPGAIDTGSHADTALEFQKPLGSGTNAWPSTPNAYPYSTACTNRDPLKAFFAQTSNRDAFMHISHTFTHYELNNSTYSDALKEIQFNQAWMQQVGISAGAFTDNGLIPPAITGLHNGDVLRAWHDAGLTNCVGDNSRPVLRNQQNPMWPYMTNMANNGYDGFTVIPRWSTRIYYNCDTGDCTTQEWIDTSAGSGTFTNLLAAEKADSMRYLFGLMHDGFMFHQANLRSTGLAAITVNGVSQKMSIFQAWVETMVAEFSRLVTWPMITVKQSDLATLFTNRMTRDACGYGMSYTVASGKITGVTVTANSNTCSVPVPVTFPGTVTSTKGFTTEQVGSDPLTIWVKLTGAAQTFMLSNPISP